MSSPTLHYAPLLDASGACDATLRSVVLRLRGQRETGATYAFFPAVPWYFPGWHKTVPCYGNARKLTDLRRVAVLCQPPKSVCHLQASLRAGPSPALFPHRPRPGTTISQQEAEQRVPAHPLKAPAAAGSAVLREGLSCITGSHYDAQSRYSLRVWVADLLPHASHNTLCSRNRVIRGSSRKRDPPLRDFRTKWRYARAGLERAVIQNARDPGPRILAANPPRHAARQPLCTMLGERKIAAAG